MTVYAGVRFKIACMLCAAVNFLSTARGESSSLAHTLMGIAATGILNGTPVHDDARKDDGEDLRPVIAFTSKKKNADGSTRSSSCTGISFGKCIVTARHCVEDTEEGSFKFFLGREMKTPLDNEVERIVRKMPTNVTGFLSLASVSGKVKIEAQSDLAVISLKTPLAATYSYSLSQLAQSDDEVKPQNGRIVGYGAKQVITNTDGKESYVEGGTKHRGAVLIKGSEGGKIIVGPDPSREAVNLALPGDSGGPLLVGDVSRPTIQGVAVNYGGTQNTYADISKNRYFLDSAIKKLSCDR